MKEHPMAKKKKKPARMSKPAPRGAKPTVGRKSFASKKNAPPSRMVPKSPSKPIASKPPAKPAGKPQESTWFDEDSHKPLIDKYARKMTAFLDAMADGKIDDAEVAAQEKRLVKAMRDVEGDLNADLHSRVTRLLCELSAYDLMQTLNTMARPNEAPDYSKLRL